MESIEEKIKEANEIVKSYVLKNFEKSSYVYIDFGLENRFIHGIQSDRNISIPEMTVEELSDYAIEQIESAANRNNLLGF